MCDYTGEGEAPEAPEAHLPDTQHQGLEMVNRSLVLGERGYGRELGGLLLSEGMRIDS